jgi:hypothetical protein
MAYFFQFEQDFVDGLQCIPMAVRLKLDTCGIKLKLDQWNHFSRSDRQELLDRPCMALGEVLDYRQFLQNLIERRTGQAAQSLAVDPNPAWLNADQIPEAVQQKAAAVDFWLSPEQWAKLSPIQRFALIKLSRSSHENSNFIPALQEFGLIADRV